MRGEGKFSAATEAEVIKAMCSASFGMQSMRTLNKHDAQEAIQLLTKKAAGWFYCESGVHVPDAKYLKRLPGGRASTALEALQTEREEIHSQLRGLCELAKRRQEASEVSVSPLQPPQLEARKEDRIAASMVDVVPAHEEDSAGTSMMDVARPLRKRLRRKMQAA